MYTKPTMIVAAGVLACLSPLAGARVLLQDRSMPLTLTETLEARTASACNALSRSFPDQTFAPNTTQYTSESHHIWSEACIFHPSCVFVPKTSKDLSKGLQVIKQSKSKFSVRSGGHMPVPGAQSVDDGVMIAMTNFNARTLNHDRSVASIGPGNRWDAVYDWLKPYGLAVNGGRYPSVAPGGLLVGGGIGYFSGRHGWGCDSVVGYEVVLADGRVVEVAAQGPYADLFWALKGGHNHFGLVTRFDVRTFAQRGAWGGVTTWTGHEAGKAVLDALDAYMRPGGGVDDPDAHINTFVGVNPANGSSSLSYSNLMFYAKDTTTPAGMRDFTRLMEPQWTKSIVLNQAGRRADWIDVARGFGAFGGNGFRDVFSAFGYVPTRQAIQIHNDTVIAAALRDLKHVEGLTVYAGHQPISRGYMEASLRANPGGNVLGLDPKVDKTFFVARIDAIWLHEKDDKDVYDFIQKTGQEVERKLKALGLWTPFIYLNDAASFQKPFQSYKNGKNLPRLRSIRDKYDPNGFLRDYLAHGFKLE